MTPSEIEVAEESFRRAQIRSRLLFIGLLVLSLGTAVGILVHFYTNANEATVQKTAALKQNQQADQLQLLTEQQKAAEAQKAAGLATLVSGISTSPTAKKSIDAALSADPSLQMSVARVFIQENNNPNGPALAKNYQRQLNAAGFVAIPDVQVNEHNSYELHYYYDDEKPTADAIKAVLENANPSLNVSLVPLIRLSKLPQKQTFALYLPSR